MKSQPLMDNELNEPLRDRDEHYQLGFQRGITEGLRMAINMGTARLISTRYFTISELVEELKRAIEEREK